jgi:hypothetical protein
MVGQMAAAVGCGGRLAAERVVLAVVAVFVAIELMAGRIELTVENRWVPKLTRVAFSAAI